MIAGKALVQPVLLYGLAAVGVTSEILKDLKGLVAKQIRVVGRCHSYYTRETNEQVFDRLPCSRLVFLNGSRSPASHSSRVPRPRLLNQLTPSGLHA